MSKISEIINFNAMYVYDQIYTAPLVCSVLERDDS